MPVKHAIWTVGDDPQPLPGATLVNEQQLESMLVRAPEIISSDWMLIGRQEQTNYGGRIDLLAIAPDASLVLIELKRNRTPREIVAQALDYASWVEQLTADRIAQIYRRFSDGGNLEDAFRQRFGIDLDEDALNQSHQVILVAAELDDSTERIVQYLNARNIAINVIFFQVFRHGNAQLLSRAWMIDPGATQAIAVTPPSGRGEREPWNGEFYVSYGANRSWDDALRYGFISGGGGDWYSRTLRVLQPGDRVWVNIPRTGYVGVGRVHEARQSLNEFTVTGANGEQQPVLNVLTEAERYRRNANDPEKIEYFVRVEWLATVPQNEAVNEVGFFGNQNTVCRPAAAAWRHTVERLKLRFPGWDR
jgi:hypothetical protein